MGRFKRYLYIHISTSEYHVVTHNTVLYNHIYHNIESNLLQTYASRTKSQCLDSTEIGCRKRLEHGYSQPFELVCSEQLGPQINCYKRESISDTFL